MWLVARHVHQDHSLFQVWHHAHFVKKDYQDRAGAKSCKPSLREIFTNVIGLASVAMCNECPKGTFWKKMSSRACGSCPSGTYQNNVGSQTCNKFPAGTYYERIGLKAAMQCMPCAKGTFYKAGSHLCTVCPIGNYQGEIWSEMRQMHESYDVNITLNIFEVSVTS